MELANEQNTLFIMNTLQDQRFSKAIEQNLEESPYYEHVFIVIDTLKAEKTYLWGGAVRDPIAKVLHGLKFKTRDFDLTVDDSKKKIDCKEPPFIERWH